MLRHKQTKKQSLPLTREGLERAMHNDELVLYYQPKVSLLSGDVIGAEALVRWTDGKTIVSPSEFLPVAEQSGLLHDLTLTLLDQLVEASVVLRRHLSHGAQSNAVNMTTDEIDNFSFSINVAPNDLVSRIISNRIRDLLQSGTIKPAHLQVEITESAVMSNLEGIFDDLMRLKSMNIKILMDDFGTGYSSIDRLSQLPFDALKLDQGVVKRMVTSPQNLDVVRSSIAMARELGMTSVAEGIESAATYQFLIAHGCEEAQGFYISKPVSFDDLIHYLHQDNQYEGSQIGRVHQASQNLMQLRKRLLDAAYCWRVGNGALIPSLVDPALETSVERSRIGIWYFGDGQALSAYPEFRAMEKPLRRIHRLGNRFLQAISKDISFERQQELLAEIDTDIMKLSTLLQNLERQLLRSTSIAGSKEVKVSLIEA